MAFKLGDVIVDRLQFGYGAKSNGAPLYALTQLTEASIEGYSDSETGSERSNEESGWCICPPAGSLRPPAPCCYA